MRRSRMNTSHSRSEPIPPPEELRRLRELINATGEPDIAAPSAPPATHCWTPNQYDPRSARGRGTQRRGPGCAAPHFPRTRKPGLRDRSGESAGLRLILSAAAWVMLFTTIAAAATSADCSAPAVTSDGWAVSSPAEQGLSPQLVCSIGSGLAMLRDADPHGVVVNPASFTRLRTILYRRGPAGMDAGRHRSSRCQHAAQYRVDHQGRCCASRWRRP